MKINLTAKPLRVVSEITSIKDECDLLWRFT